MATLDPAPRKIYQQRTQLTGLPLYYEGFLWIKRPRSKPQEAKYWTELRGTKLFLYADKKQEKFTESIELQNLSTISDKQWAEVVLTLDKDEVAIRTEIAEDVEEWKGFILTVVKQSVPNSLTLLPGQLIRLKEILEKETARIAELKRSLPLPSNPGPYEDVAETNTMPLCFHNVSRQEAADMLLKNETCGNLILRPGAEAKHYAVTIREPSESRQQVKHYKILQKDSGFCIELDRPVLLNSLDDVVNHFVTETRGKLKPYVSNIYDTQIDYAIKEDTQKTPTQSNVKKLASRLSASSLLPALRGMENSYVNVFPGK